MLNNPAITAPIIGATKMEHLEGAVAALSVTLSKDDIGHLEELPLIAKPIGGAFYHAIAALAQALRPSPYSVMKNASATTGNARPTHAASVHPPSAYAQPPSAEPTAPPMKKAAT
jgi:hypothetical protein